MATAQRTRQPRQSKQPTTPTRPRALSPAVSDAAAQADDGGVEQGVERIAMTYDTRLLLTVTEAARRLSLSRSYLYRLLDRGEIASITIGSSGRARRIPVAALSAYIASQMAAQGVTL